MESMLTCYGLLGFVDGTLPCPPKLVSDTLGVTMTNMQYTTWIKLEQCVRT